MIKTTKAPGRKRPFLQLELVAEGRSGESASDYQAEWLAGLTAEERYKYFGALCFCPHIRDWHGKDGRGHCRACKCERFHCRACDTKGGHQATCKHYVLGEGTPVK